MGFFSDMAGAVGAAAVNNIFGIMSADHAREENFRYGEMQADNADKRTRNLYRDLYSIPAQMSQLKEAGLSPSLYYGDAGGISGQTGAMGSSAAGQYQVFGIDPLTMSQIQVNNAQAKKLNAEADTESGENERGSAQIAKIWADLGATKASEELTRAQKTWQEFTNRVNSSTENEQIWRIQNEARKSANEAEGAFWEAKEAGLQFNFNKDNYETELKKSKQELTNLIAGEKLSKAEAERIVEETLLMYDKLLVQEQEADAATQNAEAYAKYVEAFSNNLPKQLELRGKELQVEKWRIGVGAFTETVRTVGYFLGAQQLGDGGTTTTQTSTDYNGKGKPTHSRQTSTTTRRLPKIR